jgi:hypothetical protein
MQTQSSNLLELLKSQNNDISLSLQSKGFELQKTTIQLSNLAQMKHQLSQQLDICKSQLSQLQETNKELQVD